MSKKIFATIINLFVVLIFSYQLFPQTPTNYKVCADKVFDSESSGNFASDNESIFLALKNNSIIAFDKKNLDSLWSVNLGGEIISGLVSHKNTIFVITEVKTEQLDLLWEINSSNGVISQRVTLVGIGNEKLFVSDNALFIGNQEGVLQRYPLDSHSDYANLHEAFISIPDFSDPLIQNSLVYYKSDKTINSLDLNNNQYQKIFENQNTINFYLINFNNSLVIGDNSGWIKSFNLLEKKIRWKYHTGGRIVQLLIRQNFCIAFSYDGFIYCFTVNSGKLKWKKRLNAVSGNGTLILDDWLLVHSPESAEIIFLDIKSGKMLTYFAGVTSINQTDSNLLKIDTNHFIMINSNKLQLFSNQPCNKTGE